MKKEFSFPLLWEKSLAWIILCVVRSSEYKTQSRARQWRLVSNDHIMISKSVMIIINSLNKSTELVSVVSPSSTSALVCNVVTSGRIEPQTVLVSIPIISISSNPQSKTFMFLSRRWLPPGHETVSTTL